MSDPTPPREGAHDATAAAALDGLAADLRAGEGLVGHIWVDRADVVVKRADLALALGLARRFQDAEAYVADQPWTPIACDVCGKWGAVTVMTRGDINVKVEWKVLQAWCEAHIPPKHRAKRPGVRSDLFVDAALSPSPDAAAREG